MSDQQRINVHERMSSGVNRARLALEARRSALPLVIIAVGAALSLGAWLVIFKNVGKYAYAKNHEIGLRVSDATGVVGGGRQEVRLSGVPAGVIDSIETRNGRPFIKVKVYRDFLPVYRDARVNLRPNTALEDMYLDIVDRGHSAAGEASVSHPIAESHVKVGVQVEEVLQALDPDVRQHMAALLDELGAGIGGRGDSLREAFANIVPFLQSADRLSAQLAHRADATRRLVHNTAAITRELGRRDRTLRALVVDSGRTLRTLQRAAPDLDATLRGLPPTLTAADASFATVRAALPDLNRAVVALRSVAERLPSGLRAARVLSADARPALTALRPSVTRLSTLSKPLAPAASWLAQAFSRLRPQIPAVDHVTRTTAGCSTALQGFFQWTPSVMKLGDAHGAVVRGQAVVGLASTAVLKDPVVYPQKSCAPGAPIGATPGPGGLLQPTPGR